jgi:hypothetical protein
MDTTGTMDTMVRRVLPSIFSQAFPNHNNPIYGNYMVPIVPVVPVVVSKTLLHVVQTSKL